MSLTVTAAMRWLPGQAPAATSGPGFRLPVRRPDLRRPAVARRDRTATPCTEALKAPMPDLPRGAAAHDHPGPGNRNGPSSHDRPFAGRAGLLLRLAFALATWLERKHQWPAEGLAGLPGRCIRILPGLGVGDPLWGFMISVFRPAELRRELDRTPGVPVARGSRWLAWTGMSRGVRAGFS